MIKKYPEDSEQFQRALEERRQIIAAARFKLTCMAGIEERFAFEQRERARRSLARARHLLDPGRPSSRGRRFTF
jgi:hypothetical protein